MNFFYSFINSFSQGHISKIGPHKCHFIAITNKISLFLFLQTICVLFCHQSFFDATIYGNSQSLIGNINEIFFSIFFIVKMPRVSCMKFRVFKWYGVVWTLIQIVSEVSTPIPATLMTDAPKKVYEKNQNLWSIFYQHIVWYYIRIQVKMII